MRSYVRSFVQQFIGKIISDEVSHQSGYQLPQTDPAAIISHLKNKSVIADPPWHGALELLHLLGVSLLSVPQGMRQFTNLAFFNIVQKGGGKGGQTHVQGLW